MSKIYLDYINEQIELKKTSTESKIALYNWKPVEYTGELQTAPVFTIPEKRQKKNQKDHYAKILAIVDLYKHCRYSDKVTLIGIPTTSKRIISICGSQRNASNILLEMQKIGIIGLEDPNYIFNQRNKRYNRSKIYRWYPENEKKFIQYCKDNNINEFETATSKKEKCSQYKGIEITTFDKSQVKFSSKLHLIKPDNYSRAEFEEYLTCCLYENYPLLDTWQELVDYLNKTYYTLENYGPNYVNYQLRLVPTFTWWGDKSKKSKKSKESRKTQSVSKIGIRLTNSYVSAKDETKKNFNAAENVRITRKEILSENNLFLNYDVPSSVPRLSSALTTGKWTLTDDKYIKIAEEYLKDRVEYNDVEPEEIRNTVKSLFMRVYFDDTSDLGRHTIYGMQDVDDKLKVNREMLLLHDATEKVIGTSYDSEIFYHESILYLLVLQNLLERGYKTWICYDAWYSYKSGVCQSEYENEVTEILNQLGEWYVKEYRNKN